MTYLSTAEVAEIKGCSLQYVQKCVKAGKISAETKDNAANNRTEYMIPLTALPQELQMRWENQQRRSLGLEPVKKAVKAPLKTAESPRLTLDDLTDKQRSELYLWTGMIKDWLTIRDSYSQYSKGEIDEMFVQAARLKYPDLEISKDILYRRLKAYRNSDISGLIDKRGGSNKGTTVVPEFMLNAFSMVLPRPAVSANNELLQIHPGLGSGALPGKPSGYALGAHVPSPRGRYPLRGANVLPQRRQGILGQVSAVCRATLR